MKIHRAFSLLIGGILLMMLIPFHIGSNATQAQESAYPEKPITWVIFGAPGGGFDLRARAIAAIMKEYLPHDVPIILRNIVGGGGRRGVSWIYKAKPDGYTFGYAGLPGHLVYSLVAKTAYDLSKVEWIGNISSRKEIGIK